MGGSVDKVVNTAVKIGTGGVTDYNTIKGIGKGLMGTATGQNKIQGQERKIDPNAFKIANAAQNQKEAAANAKKSRETAWQASKQEQQARAGQSRLIDQLREQADGKGPSLAEAQLRSASDRTLAQQLAAAASQRGGNQASLQRALAQSQASSGAQLAQDAATMRMQEQNAAREQLASALQAQRGTDVQSQLSQEQLATQRLGQSFDMGTAQQQALANLEKMRTDQFLAAQGLTATGQQAASQAQAGLLGGVIGGVGAAMGSDKNMKKDVKDSSKDVNKFLDALSSKKYKYKDDSEAGTAPGQRYGIMAQDLEKSPMGKSFVQEINGNKMVDTVQGFGAVLAAQSELHKRLKELENKSSKKA